MIQVLFVLSSDMCLHSSTQTTVLGIIFQVHTVDGRNPKRPPDMSETLQIMGNLPISTGGGFQPSTVSHEFI